MWHGDVDVTMEICNHITEQAKNWKKNKRKSGMNLVNSRFCRKFIKLALTS